MQSQVEPGIIFAPLLKGSHAQVAELVDALVSNTSEAIRVGSIPTLGTKQVKRCTEQP